MSSLGALVCGRTLFEVAEGWQGRHTLDVPIVVVTHRVPTDWVEAHPDAPFSFVTDGSRLRSHGPGARRGSRRRSRRWDHCAAVPGPGLLDEVAVDLVPVVMGEGNRPFFGELSSQDVLLGNPTVCVQGGRVIHLVFSVQR